MGGIGKSVLAAALARDDEVRTAFPDGVFWLTFGREVDPRTRQAELVRALGEAAPAFDSWRDGRAYLSELTAARACLVILDDVWREEHAEAFTRLGDGCRLLVTTRDRAVLEKIAAAEHRLDVLSPERALDLLASGVGQAVDALPREASEIARECGFLPLAISVVGALDPQRQVRLGDGAGRAQGGRHQAPAREAAGIRGGERARRPAGQRRGVAGAGAAGVPGVRRSARGRGGAGSGPPDAVVAEIYDDEEDARRCGPTLRRAVR